MKYKILLLFILCFFIGFSYEYLYQIKYNQKPYIYNYNQMQILIKDKDIELLNINSFTFDSYFKIISFVKPDVSVSINNENIIVILNNKKYIYDYKIIEPEKIEVVKEVIKEIYIEKEISIKEYNHQKEENLIKNYDDSYSINTYIPNYLEYSEGTDLSIIISDMASKIVTNEQLTIDYSELNPNIKGNYNVYLYGTNFTYSCNINIF